MTTSDPESILKDASDLARRTNLQLLILLAGLILAWLVSIEGMVATALRQAISIEQIQAARGHYLHELREYIDLRTADMDRLYAATVGEHDQKMADLRGLLTAAVTVDVGQGIRLPIPFQLAPFAWLVLFSLLLIRMARQRAKFWALIESAFSSVPEGASSKYRLTDMPPWLTPIPRSMANVSVEMASGLLEWKKSLSWRNYLTILLAIAAVVVVCRVVWVGLEVTGLQVEHFGQSFIWTAGILAAGVATVGLVVWSLLPPPAAWPWAATRNRLQAVFPKDQQGRRQFLVGSAAAAAIALFAGASFSHAIFRRWLATEEERFFSTIVRYSKRNPRQTKVAGLERGFYRHKRSGVVHYVRADGTVRDVELIKAKNLTPVRDNLVDFPRVEAGERMPRTSSTALSDPVPISENIWAVGVKSALLEGAEEQAIFASLNGRPDDAVMSLRWIMRARYLDRWFRPASRRPSLRPVLRLADLAAGLSLRFGLGQQLGEMVVFLMQRQGEALGYLDERLALGPTGRDKACDRGNEAIETMSRLRQMREPVKLPATLALDGIPLEPAATTPLLPSPTKKPGTINGTTSTYATDVEGLCRARAFEQRVLDWRLERWVGPTGHDWRTLRWMDRRSPLLWNKRCYPEQLGLTDGQCSAQSLFRGVGPA